MSSAALPISAPHFAAAIRDLPLSTLHLKAAELRNSIAHLDYSNEALRPYAYPEASSEDNDDNKNSAAGDPDCIDAIAENEIVIVRMQERIALLKAEVERRGASWSEFLSAGEVDGRSAGSAGVETSSSRVDGAEAGAGDHWRDGTFQTGRITNGEVVMDGSEPGVNGGSINGVGVGAAGQGRSGGSRSDEELRRLLEERMRAAEAEGDEDDDGMHL